MSTSLPIATIVATVVSKDALPPRWLFCDGSEIPGQYQELISLIGNNTPNFAGRALIGSGYSNNNKQTDGTVPNFPDGIYWSPGNTGGEYSHKLTVDELPKHQHTINNKNFGIHHDSFKGEGGSERPFLENPDGTKVQSTDNEGGDKNHNTMQPYFVVHYIIYCGDAD